MPIYDPVPALPPSVNQGGDYGPNPLVALMLHMSAVKAQRERQMMEEERQARQDAAAAEQQTYLRNRQAQADKRQSLADALAEAYTRQKLAAETDVGDAPTSDFSANRPPQEMSRLGTPGVSPDEANYILPNTQVPERGISAPTMSGKPLWVPLKYRQQVEEEQAQAADVARAQNEAKMAAEEASKIRVAQASRKTPADIEAEASARAKGAARYRAPREEKKYLVDKYDPATGETTKVLATESDLARGIAKTPGSTVANRQVAARSSIQAGENLLNELKDPKFASQIGPVMGRYNSLAAAAGAGDPSAQYLVGAIKSFAALQPQIHGFRAVQMAKDVENLLNTKQSPEALSAALKGILSASYIVAERGPGGQASQPAVTPPSRGSGTAQDPFVFGE